MCRMGILHNASELMKRFLYRKLIIFSLDDDQQEALSERLIKNLYAFDILKRSY
jgi:hypothetical protein